MADEQKPKKGRVHKVVLVDREGQAIAAGATSAQEPDDQFSYGANGIQEPPYKLDSLLALAERHSTHNAALEQKSNDIAGMGWEWVKTRDDAAEEDRVKLDEWLIGLADPAKDESTIEILQGAWLDLETVGHGTIELARDRTGKLQKIYSMPAHTTRFHKDGIRMVQARVGGTAKRKWFKRWLPGNTQVVAQTGGAIDEKTPDDKAANEIFVIRRPSRRSSYYGIPTYVSAVGWIFLSLAARDDNIQFFNNRREPRWAVILKNLEEDDDLEEVLREAFTTSLTDPHKNIFIPIEGDGNVEFKQLTSDSKDISFERLQEAADGRILLAHRMPPDRLGLVRVGPLGGNATMAASRVYKEAVVASSQTLLATRMNRFIATEAPIKDTGWSWKAKELDITEEAADVSLTTAAFQANLMTLDEARKKISQPPVGPERGGDKFFYELAPGASAASAAAGSAARVGAQLGAEQAASTRDTHLADVEARATERALELLRPGS